MAKRCNLLCVERKYIPNQIGWAVTGNTYCSRCCHCQVPKEDLINGNLCPCCKNYVRWRSHASVKPKLDWIKERRCTECGVLLVRTQLNYCAKHKRSNEVTRRIKREWWNNNKDRINKERRRT